MVCTFGRSVSAAAVVLLVVVTGCNDVQNPQSPKLEAWGAPSPSGSLSGTGFIGSGTPTPGNDVQSFTFAVQSDANGVKGTFAGHDWGENADLTTDPAADARTFFTAFRTSSSFCSDPSRGAEFDAMGHLVEPTAMPPVDIYVAYTIKACDNGTPGTGVDQWSADLLSRGYHKDGTVTGEIVNR